MNLGYVILVKAKASELGLKSVTSYGGDLLLRLPKEFAIDRDAVDTEIGTDLRFSRVGMTWHEFERDDDWQDKLMRLLDVLA